MEFNINERDAKVINAFKNTKPHNDKKIFSEIVSELKTVSAVANYLNISTKLVDLKLKEYGIRVDS